MNSNLPDSTTSWGRPDNQPDIRTLRRIRQLLQQAGDIGDYTAIVLQVMVIAMLLLVLTKKDFETPIFDDGTSRSCVLDAATGDARYVE